ncbi:PF06949 family protein [Leptospira borgpetersenii serovar Pomona str. 200901868]|uniref:PF06949 family protein n=1 Tax=Leptospira borgpetersenii serovar Pomona str. 200901868 TaxID=1192866 RepID=M6WNY8_LEPBO|nr:PF06949 family protein [Leptospira borgpetersenii serovar Pomona str. 200901868]
MKMSDLFQDEEHEGQTRETVQLLDEDGNPHSFIVVEALEIGENQYLLLTPVLEEDLSLINLDVSFLRGEDNSGYFTVRLEADEYGEDFLVEVQDKRELEDILSELDADIV